jgi:hypothetical protein
LGKLSTKKKFFKSIDKTIKTAYNKGAMKIALVLTVGESLPVSGSFIRGKSLPVSGRFISRRVPACKWETLTAKGNGFVALLVRGDIYGIIYHRHRIYKFLEEISRTNMG